MLEAVGYYDTVEFSSSNRNKKTFYKVTALLYALETADWSELYASTFFFYLMRFIIFKFNKVVIIGGCTK